MAVVSIGTGWTPKPAPSGPTDITYGTINNYIGTTAIEVGSNTGITDANGGLTITFPKAFASTPTTVVAMVNGAAGVNGPDYVCRLSGKNQTDFTVKVLQGGVNWTSGSAVISVSTGTGSTTGIASTASDYAATTSGGVAGDSFLAVKTTAGFTAVTSVSNTTSVFPVSVSGFLSAVPTTSVTIDWLAAA